MRLPILGLVNVILADILYRTFPSYRGVLVKLSILTGVPDLTVSFGVNP